MIGGNLLNLFTCSSSNFGDPAMCTARIVVNMTWSRMTSVLIARANFSGDVGWTQRLKAKKQNAERRWLIDGSLRHIRLKEKGKQ